MDQGKRKAFKIKTNSLFRTLKEYKNYQTQLASYDMAVVGIDKKQTQFYHESKSAIETVKKNLIEWSAILQNFINENKDDIKSDNTLQDQLAVAKGKIDQVHQLLPAA